MNKNVAVNIVFNTKTGQLVSTTSELNKLSSATDKASASASKSSSSFGSMGASIGKLAGIGVAISALYKLTEVLKAQISSAIALEAQTEQLKASITSLVYVNSQNTSTTGELLDAQNKWNLSLKTSQKLTDDLSKSATKLGVGIDEMAAVYKSFAATGMSNMSFEETTKAVELLTIAAKTGGTEMHELVRVIDSVGSGMLPLTGTYGKFLQAQGLTNDAMKEAVSQGKFYNLLLEKLGPLQETTAFTANTYAASVARLKAAWNDIKSEAVKKYFDGIKKSINDLTAWIYKIKDEMIGFIDYTIEYMSRGFEGIVEFFQTAFAAIGDLVRWIGSLFGEATSEMSAFEIVLKVAGTTANAVGFAFKTLANMIKALVEGIKGALNALQTAYYNVKDFFGLADAEDEAKMQKLIANRQAGAEAVKGIWEKQVSDTYGLIDNLESTWTKKIEQRSKNAISPDETTGASLVQNFKSPATNALAAATKKQIDTIKSWWDAEFTLREKNIELMSEGKNKELAAEQLRFEKVISNLNFEIQKKLESGEISIEQANELYAVEEKLHERKMKQIREYNETYENLKKNIDNALEENIANALTGKFTSTEDFFKDLFSSMQTSFTQGLAQSMAQAIMSAEVMESFTKTFSTAIDGISGVFGGASGGLANVAGASGGESSFMETLGTVLAGTATGYSFGSMVYNSVSDGFTSKADKWRNLGIGASSLTGATAGALIGTSVGGPIGAAIGGLIGGAVGGISSALGFAAFGSKLEQKGQGIELWDTGTKDNLNASLYADMKLTTKKWWKKSSKKWTEYYGADSQSLRNIRATLRSYEYLLDDIGGGVQEISIAAGRYSEYASLANAGARSLINAFLSGLNVDTNAIYSVWESYASSVSKSVSEALSESLQNYIDTGNSFEAWKLEFEGKATEALEFQANLAQQQVDRLLETLGASDITVDNYLAYREQALKESFDPQTIEYINSLGEYIMSAAEASKKYEDALKEETATKLNLIDPFLSKAQKIDEISASNTDTNEKLLVSILSTLKQTLRLNQESQEASLQLQAVRA